MHLLLSESEADNTDELREKSRTITYVLLGALIRSKNYVTSDGVDFGSQTSDDSEAVADLLRSIVKSVSDRS